MNRWPNYHEAARHGFKYERLYRDINAKGCHSRATRWI